jgi:hypothetical protein
MASELSKNPPKRGGFFDGLEPMPRFMSDEDASNHIWAWRLPFRNAPSFATQVLGDCEMARAASPAQGRKRARFAAWLAVGPLCIPHA